jgi:flagellar biosynthesis GTPase FlhF
MFDVLASEATGGISQGVIEGVIVLLFGAIGSGVIALIRQGRQDKLDYLKLNLDERKEARQAMDQALDEQREQTLFFKRESDSYRKRLELVTAEHKAEIEHLHELHRQEITTLHERVATVEAELREQRLASETEISELKAQLVWAERRKPRPPKPGGQRRTDPPKPEGS